VVIDRSFANLSRACAAAAAALLMAGSASAASGRVAANPIIFVNFFANSQISVTMADGTALGASSGTPTAIPAGYYTLEFSGPGGCSQLPYFRLSGPGTSIVTNGNEGQVIHPPSNVDLLPSSTYSWSDDAFPGVVYQFSTTSQVVGSPPGSAATGSGSKATVSSTDVVGSGLPATRGSLTAAIGAGGTVTLRRDARPVKALPAGRYTLTVVDLSKGSGFTLVRAKPRKVAVARSAFSGKRSFTVTLGAGTWAFTATPGAAASFVVRP
jgi:hypothetical protein